MNKYVSLEHSTWSWWVSWQNWLESQFHTNTFSDLESPAFHQLLIKEDNKWLFERVNTFENLCHPQNICVLMLFISLLKLPYFVQHMLSISVASHPYSLTLANRQLLIEYTEWELCLLDLRGCAIGPIYYHSK